jgi:TM2 domain-containing membrane protein YozV
MKGTILDYSVQSNTGYISGDDGQRYLFQGSEWRSPGIPERGKKVDFTLSGNQAAEVFLAIGSNPSLSSGNGTEKSKTTAGLLAIFLGGFGVHKFYLGYQKPGIIHLLCGTVGWFLVLPGIASGIVALIEGIIYLTKSNEEFDQIYIQNKKEWF